MLQLKLIIGYYLIDNYSETENSKYNRELIQKLKGLNLLDDDLKIGSRAQAVIDIKYHNQGISRMMFDVLKVQLTKKFDALFTAVSKLNPKLIAHQKVGWQVIHEDNDWFYVLYNL